MRLWNKHLQVWAFAESNKLIPWAEHTAIWGWLDPQANLSSFFVIKVLVGHCSVTNSRALCFTYPRLIAACSCQSSTVDWKSCITVVHMRDDIALTQLHIFTKWILLGLTVSPTLIMSLGDPNVWVKDARLLREKEDGMGGRGAWGTLDSEKGGMDAN